MLSFPYAFEPLTQKANPRQLLRTHHAKSMKTKSRMLRINDSRQHDIPKNQNMKSSYKINMTAATLIAAGSFASVHAAVTWDNNGGTGDNEWGTSTNWDPAAPAAADDVTIANGNTVTPLSPLCSGPKAASTPSRQKQIPSSDLFQPLRLPPKARSSPVPTCPDGLPLKFPADAVKLSKSSLKICALAGEQVARQRLAARKRWPFSVIGGSLWQRDQGLRT